MRLATVEQCREIDRRAQSEGSLSADVLMEAAGALSAQNIFQSFNRAGRPADLQRGALGVFCSGVAIICGPGHNGGDGLVCARHLLALGVRRVSVFLYGGSSKYSDLFKLQLERLKASCSPPGDRPAKFIIRELPTLDRTFRNELKADFGLIVDALYGNGLRAPLPAELATLITFINDLKLPVVSLDLPTGLDADTGCAQGVCVRAHTTLTYGLAKPGFFVNQGPAKVGRLQVLPIGLPRPILNEIATTHFLVTAAGVRRFLPLRTVHSNKASSGSALIYAGRNGFWGAGLLAVEGAFRVGAGYVNFASFDHAEAVVNGQPSVLVLDAINKKIDVKEFSSVAVGPGLGTGVQTFELILKLKKAGCTEVVLDADALTVCAEYPEIFPLPPTWILTPHAGELVRILDAVGIKVTAKEIEANRFYFARIAAQKAGCLVLLKGFRTIISDGTKFFVVASGHPALAKAGTGDTLTGFIVGLLAQKLSSLNAAALGAFIHGRIAEEWVRGGRDANSLSASDVAALVPELLQRLRKGHGNKPGDKHNG